jgi:hypothetical protein
MRRAKSSCRPISRRCSIPERAPRLALGLALALVPALASASVPSRSIESVLRADLKALRQEKRTDFRALLERWDSVYGKSSGPALKKIARDSSAPETDRYVALLAHARVAGPETEDLATEALRERSWMLRSAGLKSIEILDLRSAASKVVSILEKDPALVIRSQAIETLVKLRPEGVESALLRAAMDSKNYRPADFRKGRADWIPQKALEALRDLRPKGFSAKLLPLLNDAKDGRVRAQALHTIETLESRSLLKGKPFAERALAWSRELKAH